MHSRRGVILGSASLALAACGGGGGGGSPPPPISGPAPSPPPPGPPSPPPPAPGPDESYRNEIVGYGPLQRDPAGLFDLPAGFSYTVVSRFGDPMDDGLLVPSSLDGMGAIDLGGGLMALVRNHELTIDRTDLGPTGGDAQRAAKIGKAYGRQAGIPFPGGTTTVVYDYRLRRPISSYLSLAGTIRNCAGGVTPWGSWLSCEETDYAGELRHGYVFEVPGDSKGLVDPVPLKAMGRFVHEAAVVDPASGIAYLTEDREDGLFYRFIPANPGRLADGGRLQALGFTDGGTDTRNWLALDWPEGSWRNVRWIDMDGVDSAVDDLRLRGRAMGAAIFARSEGIHLGTGELYFTCSSGGAARIGQVMRYAPAAQSLQLFSESDDAKLFKYVDNIAVTPWSHLLLCEDIFDASNHLKAVTPSGKVYTVGRNAHPARSELAGPCFSPDGAILFLNIHHP
ncbi:MAG TPA: alkaline phosphatase PhoX, partial [Allosphingosinicella sp.]